MSVPNPWPCRCPLASCLQELGAAELLAGQACFLPCTDDGLPLIGRVPGLEGAYVATGHSCWGEALGVTGPARRAWIPPSLVRARPATSKPEVASKGKPALPQGGRPPVCCVQASSMPRPPAWPWQSSSQRGGAAAWTSAHLTRRGAAWRHQRQRRGDDKLVKQCSSSWLKPCFLVVAAVRFCPRT